MAKTGVITQAVMVQADIDVRGMGPAQKVNLADESFARQPNLLACVLALSRMGVGMVELEVPLQILFVTFQAMKRSGHAWPLVTEDVQDSCMQRLSARARFNDGLPSELADQVVQQFCDGHPERYLLAFVYAHLGDHDLLQVRTEAEKFLLMAGRSRSRPRPVRSLAPERHRLPASAPGTAQDDRTDNPGRADSRGGTGNPAARASRRPRR